MIRSDKIKYRNPIEIGIKTNGLSDKRMDRGIKVPDYSKLLYKNGLLDKRIDRGIKIRDYSKLLYSNGLSDKRIDRGIKIQDYSKLLYTNGLLDKTTFGRTLHAKAAMFWQKIGLDKFAKSQLDKARKNSINSNSIKSNAAILPDFTHSIYKGDRLYSRLGRYPITRNRSFITNDKYLSIYPYSNYQYYQYYPTNSITYCKILPSVIRYNSRFKNIRTLRNTSRLNNNGVLERQFKDKSSKDGRVLEGEDDESSVSLGGSTLERSNGMNGLNDKTLDSIESRKNITKLDNSIPINVIKEDVLLITPTLNKMANPIKNEKVAISLFNYKNVYSSDQFTIPSNLLDKCKAIWFFGHGLNHYDKLDIYISKDKKYNMDNFFIDNPDIKNIDFIFDVCYSSSLLIDFNFMNEVNKRNIRLYTCGFVKELNTINGSFLTYCLKSLKDLIGNPFLLTVKQINAWFSIISDICGYKMYCYGKDDSDINPTIEEKELAYILIKPYLIKYFNGIMVITFKGYDLKLSTRQLICNRKLKSKSFGINDYVIRW